MMGAKGCGVAGGEARITNVHWSHDAHLACSWEFRVRGEPPKKEMKFRRDVRFPMTYVRLPPHTAPHHHVRFPL